MSNIGEIVVPLRAEIIEAESIDRIANALERIAGSLREMTEPIETEIHDLHDCGDLIRQTRKEKKLCLKDIAAETGISRSTLSRLERGENFPPVDKLDAFLKALGISITIGRQ